MSRESLTFLIGLVVFLTPFMGFPNDWKQLIFVVCGALLLLVGYSLRRQAFLRSIDDGMGGKRSDVFVESTVTPKVATTVDEVSTPGADVETQ